MKEKRKKEVGLQEAWHRDSLQLMADACIGCGRCRKACLFLEKYGIDLKGLSERTELLYSCFLCDRCREVCPMEISGRGIALKGRRMAVEEQGGRLPVSGCKGLLWEKDPYRFANHKGGNSPSVFFPGCNLPSFFPKTTKQLSRLFSERGIGTVYDCCGKPVEELGLSAHGERNLEGLAGRLKRAGVRELILACPNCYYYLKGRLPEEIRLVTVYRKLSELSLGNRIEGEQIPLYLPCPDREEQIFLKDLEAFLPGGFETETYGSLQCCGLGGCAFLQEPELAEEMTKAAAKAAIGEGKDEDRTEALYTYCASCVSRFQRKGIGGAVHVLPLILEIREEMPKGIRPFLNRALGLRI